MALNLENQVFDTFMGWTVHPGDWPDSVKVLLVDEIALEKMEKIGRWPWPRDAQAAIVDCLHRAGARAVILDLLFPDPSKDAIPHDRFATSLRAAGNVWLAAKRMEDGHVQQPTESLASAVGPRIGLVNVQKDPDGILRSYPLDDSLVGRYARGQGWSLPPHKNLLLRWYGAMSRLEPESVVTVVQQGFVLRDAILRLGKPKDFETEDWKQVAALLRQQPLPASFARFKDKVVFVGPSAAGAFDPLATPVSDHDFGVSVHATALANLMRGDFLRPVSPWVNRGLILLAAVGVTLLTTRISRLLFQTLGTLLFLAALFATSFLLFRINLWLPPLMAILAGLLSFSGITAWHYFTEGRQKRFLRQLFSDFVSPDVLAELQSHPQGLNLRGDRRQGTVFFCDLAGFTTFAETAPSEQFLDAINTYLAEASRILIARGAYVDKFIGDAVMAVFGVLRPQADHGAQACLAAIELQEMMVQLNERLGRQYGLKNLTLRVGVNSGEMIAGPMGYARKLNYSVLGDTVNLASRLEGANKEYHTSMLIGRQTWEMAREVVETRPLDLLRVKGKTQPVPVYEIMARKGGLDEKRSRLRDVYLEGLAHYRERRWTEAAGCFRSALELDPEDGPSQTYASRCAHDLKNPPGSDWDGSFQMDRK